ncbi:MAG: FliG C-terminal domain-containing protein [Pirellulaceae bacterium]
MKLSQHQQRKFASLLVNLSSQTATRILDRFDPATQAGVRSRMEELAVPQPADEQLLAQFAEFLYFEPAADDPRGAILKPDVSAHTRSTAGHGPTDKSQLEFHELFGLGDSALDTLLENASPELTVAALCCSPQSFVQRVLDRLSADEARQVRQQINNSSSINWKQMQVVQQQYCRLASQLIERGAIER